jgi:subtilisin-like proprotein convertase family protein
MLVTRNALLALAGLAVAATAEAATTSGSGPGFAIPDDEPAGASSTATVTDDLIISSLSVTLSGLTGTWVGDLIATVESPDGTTADLFFRTGDPQGDCCGDSSDVAGDYTFADGGDDWWAAAAAAGGSEIISSGTYQATTSTGTVVSLDGTFGGSSSLGDWILTISDNAGGDPHSLDVGWRIDIEGDPAVIPVPAAAWLFMSALAGLGTLRRKR